MHKTKTNQLTGDHKFLEDLGILLKSKAPEMQTTQALRKLSTHLTLDISIVKHPDDLTSADNRDNTLSRIRALAKNFAEERELFNQSSTTFTIRVGINPDYWAHRLRPRLGNVVRATFNQFKARVSLDPRVTNLDGEPMGSLYVTKSRIELYEDSGKRHKFEIPRSANLLRDDDQYILITAKQDSPDSALVLPSLKK